MSVREAFASKYFYKGILLCKSFFYFNTECGIFLYQPHFFFHFLQFVVGGHFGMMHAAA